MDVMGPTQLSIIFIRITLKKENVAQPTASMFCRNFKNINEKEGD